MVGGRTCPDVLCVCHPGLAEPSVPSVPVPCPSTAARLGKRVVPRQAHPVLSLQVVAVVAVVEAVEVVGEVAVVAEEVVVVALFVSRVLSPLTR